MTPQARHATRDHNGLLLLLSLGRSETTGQVLSLWTLYFPFQTSFVSGEKPRQKLTAQEQELATRTDPLTRLYDSVQFVCGTDSSGAGAAPLSPAFVSPSAGAFVTSRALSLPSSA